MRRRHDWTRAVAERRLGVVQNLLVLIHEARVVGSRVDDVPIDLQRAYKRTLQLTISRLRAYGEKWKLWCNKNRHTGLKSIIPVDKRDRTVIEQDMEGDYQLHPILIQEFTRIQQEISRKKA